MPGSFLTNAERERLNSFPFFISEEDLISFFTLSDSDRIAIEKLRGIHNRFGFSLQICTLRYLGFLPQNIINAPVEVLQFLREQLALSAECLKEYGKRLQTRREHLQLVFSHLGFRRINPVDWKNMSIWLIDRALEHDKPTLLLGLACKYLHTKKIIRPGITRLEGRIIEARQEAWNKTYLQLSSMFNEKLLDDLLCVDSDLGKTPIAWLRQGATSNSALSILRSLKKISFLRNSGANTWDLSAMNPNRLKFLAQMGRKATNQYLQRLIPERRYPILVAFLRQSLVDITDEVVEIFDQALWDRYGDSKDDFDEFHKQTLRSKDKNLKLFQRIIPYLVATDIEAEEIISRILKVAPRKVLMDVYEEISTTVRKHEGHFDFFAKRFSYIQRFAPEFLKTFEFKTGDPDDDLIMAIRILCKYNTKPYNDPIPNDAPIGFVSSKWKPYIFDEKGNIVRKYYVLCVLWELRSALRAGNIWLEYSRRYISIESCFIPEKQWPELKDNVCSLINAPQDGNIRLKERQQSMESLLRELHKILIDEKTEGMARLEKDEIILSPLEAEGRSERVKALEEEIVGRLPRLDLTELLIEVDSWIHFTDHFTHAAESEARSKEVLTHIYACIIAEACNFGFEQMEQSSGISYRKLAWCNTWYIREETLKQAFSAIVDYHHNLPLSQYWGGGTLSSSDGQRFPVSVKSRKARPLPKYFGYGKGLAFYTWTSDQLSQYGAKVIVPTKDAAYVLDEILDNETELDILEHTVDTAGHTDRVSGAFDLLGLVFSPRLKDISDQTLYRFPSTDMSNSDSLRNRIKGVINEKLILEHWDDLLRLAGSLKLGWVSASLLLQKLQAISSKNKISAALQEYGRISKTINILKCYVNENHRRKIGRQLNKGEALHSLRSSIFHANKARIRRRHEDEQLNQANCLNLVTNAVVVWNTVYMEAVIKQLRSEGMEVMEEDIRHLWPTRYEHINMYGKFLFNVDEEINRKGLRKLRRTN